MRFFVLNEGGRDGNMEFPDGAGIPGRPGHPPVNHHGYAACMRGAFVRKGSLVADGAAVLVLLRRGNLGGAARLVRWLKARGCFVLVACKEAGGHQVAELLGKPRCWRAFCDVCAAADGAVAGTPGLVPVHEAAGSPAAIFLPTPYPVGVPGWEVSVPLERRTGIMVGTREFDVPSRNHLAGVAVANRLAIATGCRLTVINTGGRADGRMLREVCVANPGLEIIDGRLDHGGYLRLTAAHRLVFQLDASAVPGQVAGDALLAGTPCIGGNSAIERLVFPCPPGRAGAVDLARRLLADDVCWNAFMESARRAAVEHISFEAVARRLAAFVARG